MNYKILKSLGVSYCLEFRYFLVFLAFIKPWKRLVIYRTHLLFPFLKFKNSIMEPQKTNFKQKTFSLTKLLLLLCNLNTELFIPPVNGLFSWVKAHLYDGLCFKKPRQLIKASAGLWGESGATWEAWLLPSAEDMLSSVLHSNAGGNLSFLLFEQELEGMVWLYSVSGFVLFVF